MRSGCSNSSMYSSSGSSSNSINSCSSRGNSISGIFLNATVVDNNYPYWTVINYNHLMYVKCMSSLLTKIG